MGPTETATYNKCCFNNRNCIVYMPDNAVRNDETGKDGIYCSGKQP